MASVTQTINSYTGGISQQPDSKKVPGQVVDAINVLPDVTQGLQKRPGAELVASLSDNSTSALNSQTNGRWFHYYRDENEQYIGQVSRSGDVNIWCCSDIYVSGVKRHSAGEALDVIPDGPTASALASYLTHTDDQDIQTLTLNDFTYLTNRLKPTGMAATTAPVRPHEAYIELKKVAYSRQYSLNIFDDNTTEAVTTVTRMTCALVASSNNYCNGSGAMVGRNVREWQARSSANRCDNSAGSGEDSLAPNTATDIFSVGSGISLTDEGLSGGHTYKVAVFNTGDAITNSKRYTIATGDVNTGADTITITGHGRSTGDPVLYDDTTASPMLQVGGSNVNEADHFFIIKVDDDTIKLASSEANANNGTALDITGTGNSNQTLTYGPSYHRDGTDFYVNVYQHGLSTGDIVDLNFEGSGTDGQYEVTVDSGNNTRFQITDHAGGSASTNRLTCTYCKGDTTVDSKKDLYFQITNISQAIPTGSGSNVTYQARYTTTHDVLYGGGGWLQNDYFYVWMKDGLYQINITEVSTAQVQANLGLIRPQPTPFDTDTTTTAELILGDIQYEILNAKKANADGSLPRTVNSNWYNAASDVRIIGSGIYITDASAFNLTAIDDELLNVVTNEIQTIDDLPGQCKHGFVVKVKNSEANEDDYYLQFEGQNGRDGKGSWEECPAPGRLIAFDPAKMPIQLIRQYNGSTNKVYFDLKQVVWEDCLVGNTTTVPKPSFISTENGVDDDEVTKERFINKMIFWRNRLVMLSEEDVILSQPGDFFNFWPKSSITYTATDNIDISCSSEFPADIYDGIHTNSGLVLFTKTTQFLLTTDSDVLSPQTAKLNTIASYNFNNNTNPISLGTTIGFLDNAGKYSRFWEMAQILREGEPIVIDQTKVVSKLFDKNLNKISNSRENSVIFFSEKDKNILYGFSYYATSEKRLQQAWFKWKFSGTIQHHCVLDDSLYLVIRDAGKDTMQRVPIKMDTETLAITDDFDTTDTTDDITYRVHLDNSQVITASQLGYSTTSGRTGFTKPDGFNSATGQLVVYCHKASTTLPNEPLTTDNTLTADQIEENSDLIGSYTTASVVGNPGNYNIEWDGDWTGHDIIVGYLFDMEVEFPTIYYTQVGNDIISSDQSASLVVHRVKLSFGASGMYTTKLERKGKPTYSETYEPPLADSYNANKVGINEQITKQIPVYEKNKNFTLTLTSSHPAPATLYSMTWEGLYNRPYYKQI